MLDPIVQVDTGLLRGTVTQNYIGETTYAFLGVPYGKPPIDDLRFKAPVPAEPWTGIRNATEKSSKCYQHNLFNGDLEGSEDCLYLNVFTKNLATPQSLLPVMLFLYGGAFMMGDSEPNQYNPAFLLMEDIVYVSINYRVGVLGFLSLNDTSLGVPGNAGLKDQVLALKWVQKNIRKFGGDPKSVTIFGESAGSASVHYHILSPLSKGLFHKGIMESGSALNPWARLHPQNLDILDMLQIKYQSDEQVLGELLKIPVENLVGAQRQLYFDLEDNDFRLFGPTVEKSHEGAFLDKNPIDVMTSGEYNKVPTIIGFNSNEGLYAVRRNNGTIIVGDQYVPRQIILPADPEKKEKLLEKIRVTYRINEDRKNEYLAIGDSMFVAGIIGATQNMVITSSENIYLYVFHLVASRNHLRLVFNLGSEYKGACHADELGYIFDDADLKQFPPVPGSIENFAVKSIVKLWVNFAKYGNPTPLESQLNLTWKPVTNDTLFYLHFDKTLTVKTNPWKRISLWREIFKASNETKDYMP